jgi:hypothetical protein
MNSVHSEKDMNAKAEALAKEAGKKTETLVDAVFDLGLSWAEFGVSQGKLAMEQSAKTLTKVAKSLDDLQKRLRKD